MAAMQICEYLWMGFFVVWVAWALKTKPTASRESASSRLSYTILTVAAYYLMFAGDIPHGFFRSAIFTPTGWSDALGIAITVAGIAFAFWARIYLGRNWSGAVTVKVDHQLIRTGPYRWVRHPIYTGLITAMMGTAIVLDQVRGLIAVVLAYQAVV
jgi:protein-S-isoprenylcysteine O-methyltransferase Ste14